MGSGTGADRNVGVGPAGVETSVSAAPSEDGRGWVASRAGSAAHTGVRTPSWAGSESGRVATGKPKGGVGASEAAVAAVAAVAAGTRSGPAGAGWAASGRDSGSRWVSSADSA